MTKVLALNAPQSLMARAKAAAETLKALARANPRAVLAGSGGIGATILAAGALSQIAPVAPPAGAAVPVPPAMVVKAISPSKALAVNAAIPLDTSSNPAADPFKFKGTKEARAEATQCLALAVYYEAGNQDEDGARAVAQVVLNRVRHSAFPSTVCGVVYEGSTRPTGCQFTFTCDGSLSRTPDLLGWRRAWNVAAGALAGEVYAPVGWATHYHANYVVPVWASSLAKSAVVGDHLFYRWAGIWGRPRAFTQRYAGKEPNAVELRSEALVAEESYASVEKSPSEEIAAIPGAEELVITPSMRGDKRVAVRFNQVARNASDHAKHEDYSDKFAASDTLRWSLSSDDASPTEAALGSSTTR